MASTLSPQGSRRAARDPTGAGKEQNKRVKRRHVCEGCGRPSSVCYCSTVSGRELNLSDPSVSAIVDRVLVFLHPLERKRKNGSLQVLQRLVKGINIWPHRRPGCCPFASEQQQQQQPHRATPQAEGCQSSAEAERVGETLQHTVDRTVASATLKETLAVSSVEAVLENGNRQDQKQQGQQQQEQHHHLCTRDGIALCDTSRMVLLFPTESSLPLGTGSLPLRLPITLLAIDGTWKEANEMLRAAPWLQQLPAVHLPHSQVLPVEQGDPLEGVSSFATASGRSTCSTTRSESCEEALRVSGAYGLIRTPPARVAAKGGVCTAEAIAEALAILGRWGRTTAPSLLQIADTTRQTLQRIVALQQQMRKQTKNSENTLDSAIGAKGAATPRRPSS
ncbi:uncharacterized protein LOC34620094 [Cyclospora cayetanensis]|uniref:tRNA-uridine aminocarboxypropyltransferase n=1 Tax=Cyclospora cayetanensis TaxID=88456 RepID=A0A6P6S214_9EIME|nr:uncharacterized protein LOC34620094 [Cyclospora cayetanensis]